MVRVLQDFKHADSSYIMPEGVLSFISKANSIHKSNYLSRMNIMEEIRLKAV